MTYLLIDANSLMNRAFYGIRPLTTSSGLNTNAIYGFLNILNKHMAHFGPCQVYAAFDRREKTYRHELYDGYKAGRKGMPPELAEQFPVIKELLKALGVLCIEKPGLEADDIIGTLSVTLSDDTHTCTVITGDRDTFQLISDKVTVCLATTKEDEMCDPAYIQARYGLTPKQMIDLKALMGDASDNIPGVAGVGEKTALTLLRTYGTLEAIYENIDKIKGALQTKLTEGRESAFLSRKLGTIVTDADLSAETGVCLQRDNDALRQLLTSLEMPSMIAKFCPTEDVRQAEEKEAVITEADTLPSENVAYVFLADGFLYAAKGDETCKIPVTKAVLEDLATKEVVTHDAKPLMRLMLENGLWANVTFDTMLAAYLINPSRTAYPLQTLVGDYTSETPTTKEAALPSLATLKDALLKRMEEDGLADLYHKIELPLCAVLARMEHRGFPADREFLLSFGAAISKDIELYTEEIYRETGREFNINSTKQLGTILFEERGLPVVRKTKTGYSTDNEVLETLWHKTGDPLIQNIMDYRKLVKLRSTYVDGLIDKIGDDGRIHTVFTQTVTQTGRISSTEPNLQNIPVRTALGRELRKAFTARKGYALVDADYSQIELRVLAHMANDHEMCEAFRKESDIHTKTASQVFGLPEEMITSELRRRAKAVNFGIVYGIGDYSLSRDIGVTVKEAKQYIENYFTTYSGVRSYMDGTLAFAKENGYVSTIFGRRRYVPDIHAKNHQLRSFAERVCMNTPIQGTAADIIKLAMINVDERLRKEGTGATLILQVHDELIVETPIEHLEATKQILKEEMENAVKLSVPLTADVGTGKTWFESKQ